MTTHKDSSRHSDREDFVSIYENNNRGRFIFCRLCQRGNSPADHELDEELVQEVLDAYPNIADEAINHGDRSSMKFIRNKIYDAYNEKYDEFHQVKAVRKHLIDYLGWSDTGLIPK